MQERHLRVYTRLSRKDARFDATVEALHASLDNWMRQRFDRDFVSATPRPRQKTEALRSVSDITEQHSHKRCRRALSDVYDAV